MQKIFLLSLLLVFSSFQRIEERAILPILSPAFSQRQTSKLELDNGLNVYLISDPQAPKSAAALSVHAGSWMDPQQHLGMAHFLEHMLFLATKKYPVESEYDRFLKAHGGRSNAFTESLYTTYSFEVDTNAFQEALDRFSCFFYQPLLSPSGVAREINAIQSEYAGHLENDNTRRYFVQKFLSNPNHAEHRMNIGNRDTLHGTTTDELRAWFESHYNAGSMYLVIYTSLPLAQIEEWVVQKFSPIPSKETLSFQINTPILDPKLYKHAIFIEPIHQKREITLVWELPSEFGDAEMSRPYDIISHILGHEGEKSLLSALRAQDLATSVSAGKTQYVDNGLLFYIQIDLTKKGIKNFQTVIKRVFQAIKRIESRNLPQTLFDDLQQIQKIRFQYPKLEAPFESVTTDAVRMREEPLSSYPYHSTVIQKFNPQIVREMAALMSIDRCQIYVMAKESDTHIEASLREPWMQIPFAIRPLPLKLVEESRQPPLDPEIDLPALNPFIPKTLTLKNTLQIENFPNPKAELIVDKAQGKLYFAADTRYGTPEISYIMTLRTPYVHSGDASSVIHADLAIVALKESINSYGYVAKMAGLDYEINRANNGITFKINGYSEHAPQLLTHILATLRSLQVEVDSFERLKNNQLEKYQNYAKKGPLLRGIDQFKRFFYLDYVTENSKAKEMANLTHESMNRYLKGLLDQVYLEAMVYGNIEKKEAEDLWLTIWNTLKTNAYLKEDHLKIRLALFPQLEGPLYLNYPIASKGNALVLAIEQDPYSVELHACHDIASSLLFPLYFSSLRTQQQTGYQVAVVDQEVEKQLLMLFLIETYTHEPRDLLARTEAFLETFVRESTSKEYQENFEAIRLAKIQEMLSPPENMQTMGERLYDLAFVREGNFNWYQERATSLRHLQLGTFNEQIQTLFGRSNHKRLGLLIQGKLEEGDQFHYRHAKSGKWLQDLSVYRTKEERE